MPLYDYRCAACGAEFEVERPLGAPGKVRCTQCRSLRTEKVFGAAGIVFRGSGFYVTDSKAGSPAPASKPAAGSPDPPAGGASTPEKEPPAPSKDKAKPVDK